MSAIAGVLARETDLEHRCKTMLRAMRSRGPDASHVWCEDTITLGCACLYTTPESLNDSMPWKDRSRDVVITADLRIDNREELINTLKVPATVADSRIVVSAYAKWGTDCVQYLQGDFAFAIWDRVQQRLFCARDHFGLRPFYYTTRNSNLAFASTAEGVLASGLLPRRIHEPRIADYLSEYLEGIDETVTFYEDIVRLPPAHYLLAEPGKVRIGRYWTLEPHEPPASDDAQVEGFKTLFEQAVRSRLRTRGDPGSMLSGGLDSSSIVCVSRELVDSNRTLHTFSATSDMWETSRTESHAIESVISLGGMTSHTITPAYLSGRGQWLEDMLQQTDDLFDSTILCIPWLMYREASRLSVPVVLDGLDGDLVFWLNDGCTQYLIAQGRLLGALKAAKSYAHFYEEPLALTLARGVRSALRLRSEPWYGHIGARRRTRLYRDQSDQVCESSLMRAEFAARVELSDRINHYHGTNGPNTIEGAHAGAITGYGVTAALERYGRVAAAHSVEARTPIYDKKLVEFCLSLPWQQKALSGMSKPIIRKAMKGRLPEIVLRRKSWESVGPDYWWGWWDASRDLVDYAVNDCLDAVQGFVDTGHLRKLYGTCTTCRSADLDWDESPQATVFHIALLALWLTYQKARPSPG